MFECLELDTASARPA